ncbi:26S protease regulatory subunit 8, partial [Puccinia sorghi]
GVSATCNQPQDAESETAQDPAYFGEVCKVMGKKYEINKVIELPMKQPELFEALGIAQLKEVLLYGPPGTGKMLLARAIAHHTDCWFIRVSGSKLVKKYVHWRGLADGAGALPGQSGSGGGNSVVQRTMLELLNQLDGFEPSKNIKAIMAPNCINIFNSALLRPGRVDQKIEFPPPGPEAR